MVVGEEAAGEEGVGKEAVCEATASVAMATPNVTGTDREWHVIAATVPGASHLRAKKPNQDAILQIRESSIGLPLIVSISDGHGSDKCFRSDRGSHLAVTIGSTLLRETLRQAQRQADFSQMARRAKETLPTKFAQRWKTAVEADLQHEPFTEEELGGVETKAGPAARQLVETHPLLAYGATALVIGLTQSFIIYLQLGDGEIMTVSETGDVLKPLPEDENLIANETTSLCLDTAAQDFRFACQPLPEPPPALILMTTDGYANSFADEAGFLKVGSDILEMLRADGFDVVNRSVKSWLEEATQSGSGDDCTLAIICRMDALEPPLTNDVKKVEATAESTLPIDLVALHQEGTKDQLPIKE
jgi:serine/threonine protein phosphatase PrpC